MSIWPIIGIIAASLTSFGFVPQIMKMYRTKSVEDISLLTLFQFGTGIILWTFYGIHLNDYVIIGANLSALITIITAVILYFTYSREK